MEEELLEAIGQLRQEMAAMQAEIASIKAQLGSAPAEDDALLSAARELQREVAALAPTVTALSQTGDAARRAQLVVELIEICEDERRHFDPDGAFCQEWPERLQALLQLAGLEAIQPARGEPYRGALHSIRRSVRGDGPRDHVERCLARGFRYQGQLLRKAEVSVYL